MLNEKIQSMSVFSLSIISHTIFLINHGVKC